jgi:hypothetical protein
MYLKKVISEKILNKKFLVGVLKVTRKEQDLDLDPLFRGKDPPIRVRIRTKMLRIQNTGFQGG